MAGKNSNRQYVKLGSINIDHFSIKSQVLVDKYNEEEDFDLILIQETGTVDKEKLRLSNMKVFTDTNEAKNRGTATFIKMDIPCKDLPEIAKVTKEIDSVWCFVVVKNKRYIVGNIYAKHHYKNALDDVIKMLKVAQNKSKQLKAHGIILGGDFNSRHTLWNDRKIDANGKKLVELLNHTEFSIISSKTPSFLCIDGSSNIDLMIMSNSIARKVKSCKTDDLVYLHSGAPERGHVPLITEIQCDGIIEKAKVTYKLDVNSVDWGHWKEDLESKLETDHREILRFKNPKNLWNYFKNTVNDITKKHGVMKKSCQHSRPFWTKKLTDLRNNLKIATKRYRKRNTESNLRIMQEAKEEFDDARKMECQNFLLTKTENLNAAQVKTFWTEFNRLFKTKTEGGVEPLDDTDGGLLTENKDIENKLFETFFECKHMQDGDFDNYFYTTINDLYEEIMEDTSEITDHETQALNSTIKIDEILKAIKRTNPNKVSFDNSNMHPKMLHNLGAKAIKLIQRLFNLSLNRCQWIWNEAEIIFLRKAGKDTYSIPGSYRPISITSYIGKLLEKIIASRITTYLRKKGYHDKNQEGFTPERNTVRYINRLNLEIKSDISKKKTVIGLFIDMEKAFDSVWKRGLIVKLHKLNIKGKILHLINNFLTSRVVQLNVNNYKGEEKKCAEYGLPQGSALSPILFKIYLMDMLEEMESKEEISVLKFADDATVKVSAETTTECNEQLNNILKELHLWCQKWRMVINCNRDKTEYVCFGVAKKDDIIPDSFNIGHKLVHKVDKTKVLGVTIDSKLNYLAHGQKTYQKLCDKWVKICQYCNIHWGFNQKVMTRLINTIFLSIIQYCGHIWLSPKNSQDIIKLWNKLIKSSVGSVFNIQTSIGEIIIGVPPLSIQTTCNGIKHYLKLNISQAPEDQLKKFVNESANHLADVKHSLKEVFRYLNWKLQISPKHFNDQDRLIVQNHDYKNYCTLSQKACSYTKTLVKKYVEKLWLEKLCNQATAEGEQNVPKPQYQKLPIPNNTTRDEEVQLMSLFYPQNLFNSFVYRHTYQAESPLCSTCKTEEETPFHVIYECNSKSTEIRNIVDKIAGEDTKYADTNTLLKCSRNEKFIKLCLEVLKQGKYRKEINLN